MSCPAIPNNCPRVAAKAGFSQWANEPIWACGHTVVWLLRKVVTDDKGEIGPGALRSSWIAVAANDCRCAWLDEEEAAGQRALADNGCSRDCLDITAAKVNAEAWRKWGAQ